MVISHTHLSLRFFLVGMAVSSGHRPCSCSPCTTSTHSFNISLLHLVTTAHALLNIRGVLEDSEISCMPFRLVQYVLFAFDMSHFVRGLSLLPCFLVHGCDTRKVSFDSAHMYFFRASLLFLGYPIFT